LEAAESVADLGQKYMAVKNRLDTEWEKWNDLFNEDE